MSSRGYVLHPTLPVDRVTRRKFRMAQDSDDPLFVVNIIVWVLVVILAIVALHCPLPHRVVQWCTIWCWKWSRPLSEFRWLMTKHMCIVEAEASSCTVHLKRPLIKENLNVIQISVPGGWLNIYYIRWYITVQLYAVMGSEAPLSRG